MVLCMSYFVVIDECDSKRRRSREGRASFRPSADHSHSHNGKAQGCFCSSRSRIQLESLTSRACFFERFPKRESSPCSHHLQAIKPTSAKPAEVKDTNKRKRRHSSVGTDASASSERPKSRKGKERADEEAFERGGTKEKKAKGDKKLVPVEEIMAGGSGAWQHECVCFFFPHRCGELIWSLRFAEPANTLVRLTFLRL